MILCILLLQEKLVGLGEISYIDFMEGSTNGHLRCKNAESALKISDSKHAGMQLALLTGGCVSFQNIRDAIPVRLTKITQCIIPMTFFVLPFLKWGHTLNWRLGFKS